MTKKTWAACFMEWFEKMSQCVKYQEEYFEVFIIILHFENVFWQASLWIFLTHKENNKLQQRQQTLLKIKSKIFIKINSLQK